MKLLYGKFLFEEISSRKSARIILRGNTIISVSNCSDRNTIPYSIYSLICEGYNSLQLTFFLVLFSILKWLPDVTIKYIRYNIKLYICQNFTKILLLILIQLIYISQTQCCILKTSKEFRLEIFDICVKITIIY